MELIGEAKAKNIIRTCEWCKKQFVVSCIDYIFNRCGTIIKNSDIGSDGWLCKECSDYIIKIKNI